MSSFEMFLLVAACVIILVLAGIAFYYVNKVRQVEKQRKHNEIKQNNRLVESLQVISASIIDGQLEPIEGSIRIKVLLDNLSDGHEIQQELVVFSSVYDQVEHIPTHDAWKALPKKERRKFEMLMAEILANKEREILDACESLKSKLTTHL